MTVKYSEDQIQDMVNTYLECKNLKIAGDTLGVPWQTLYWHLTMRGVPVIGDKSCYGSKRDKLAAHGETLFETLMPEATNQNKLKFQAKFDFTLGYLKIDVKTNKLKDAYTRKKSLSRRWACSVRQHQVEADFIVIYALEKDSLDVRHIFCIPGEFVQDISTISISEKVSSSKYGLFKIEEEALRDFLLNMSQGRNHDSH